MTSLLNGLDEARAHGWDETSALEWRAKPPAARAKPTRAEITERLIGQLMRHRTFGFGIIVDVSPGADAVTIKTGVNELRCVGLNQLGEWRLADPVDVWLMFSKPVAALAVKDEVAPAADEAEPSSAPADC